MTFCPDLGAWLPKNIKREYSIAIQLSGNISQESMGLARLFKSPLFFELPVWLKYVPCPVTQGLGGRRQLSCYMQVFGGDANTVGGQVISWMPGISMCGRGAHECSPTHRGFEVSQTRVADLSLGSYMISGSVITSLKPISSPIK